MKKELSDMTLEELWQLFPIVLVEHRACWKQWYQEEAERLRTILPDSVVIHNIGSTAISGIWAKPIIDLLVEADATAFSSISEQLEQNGYLCMAQERNRMDFNRGYTPDGFAERVFHLHLREYGDHDELYFRDYLNEHPEIAKDYERLKLSLWKRYEHDRDGYTESKTDFIRKYTMLAKKEYAGRYKRRPG